jgi:hypothetical protein
MISLQELAPPILVGVRAAGARGLCLGVHVSRPHLWITPRASGEPKLVL